MDYTPRVQHTDPSILTTPGGDPTAPYTQYALTATYNMATAEGSYVQLAFDPPQTYSLDACSFALYLTGTGTFPNAKDAIVTTQANWLFDRSAEVRLVDSAYGDLNQDYERYLAAAWIWGPEVGSAAYSNVNPSAASLSNYNMLMAYEGPPINPFFWIRAGVVTGLSDPLQSVTYNFSLRVFQKAATTAARIYIPDPGCMPPFIMQGANAGKYLFGDCATYKYPGKQRCTDRRIFRMKKQEENVVAGTGMEANLFGGPWRVHVLGGGAATTVHDLYARGAESAAAVVVDTATAANVSLDSGKNVEAAKVVVSTAEVMASVATSEIMCEYQ